MTVEQAIAIGGVKVIERMLIKEYRFEPSKAKLITDKSIDYILKNGVKVEISQHKQ